MKVCTRCKIDKGDSEFRIRLDKRNGKKSLNSECKICDKERSKIYYDNHKHDGNFKNKNIQRAKDYKNKNYDAVKKRRTTAEYLKKHNDWEKKRYEKYKDVINAKNKIKRQTPEYKAYMKEYRKKRKEIIYEQEKITKNKYHSKHRDNVTEKYCLRLLRTQGLEINSESLTEKQIKVLIDRIMKRLAELEKGTFKICIMCKKNKSVKSFKIGNNYERIATCNNCIYKIPKKTKYEKYKYTKKSFI